MNLELITYGNGSILDHVMTGVANIVTSPDYSVLAMTILGLATVLGIVGYHRDMAAYGIQAHSTWIIKGVTSLAIFWMLVGGSINVFIYDPLNNFNGVVDHVPMGIAMPVYMENQISENLSTLYSEWMAPSGYPSEFSYDNPSNGAGFYNPGMVSPLHAINVLTQAHFTDSYFYESLSDFTQGCLIPAMMLGVVNPNQFYIAGPGQAAPDDSIQDLLTADMANMPSGWTSVIYTSGNPGGTTETCTNSWNTLNNDVNNMTAPNGSLAGQYGGYLNTATGSNQTALADQALLGNAAGYMLNISTTGQQMLGQAALMNSLSGPIAQFAQSTGTSTQAQAYALTQAFNQSENSWTTSAIMSAKMLPIFHLIMEMIVVAIFPLFFALAVVPTMTMKYLKLLFELLMWLALWSPLASVINFLVQSFMESKVFNNVSSTALSGVEGFNYANYSFIAHNSIVYTAVTGAIMWIIPVLSFGLVTGSAFVMSEAIGAVGSTAHGSAQSQGASVGTSSGLQGIEGQGSNLAKGQAFESQGKSWASADEKIAGMGGLDNLANASGTANAIRAESYAGYTKGVASNKLQSIASGVTTAGQAQNLGNFKGEQALSGMAGADTAARELGFSSTQQYLNATATAAGINSGAQGLANMQHPNTFESRALMNESNKLASAMQYQTFMQQTGMLPKNFSSLAPQQKLEALMSADKNLTGNYSGVNLDAAQAHKLGLPAAGTYDFHMNAQGQMVAVSGRGSESFTGILNTASGKFVGTETGEVGGKPIYTSGNRGGNLSTDHINKGVNDTSQTNKWGVTSEGSPQALNDYARQYMESSAALKGEMGQYSNPGNAIKALNEVKTLAKEGQFAAAGAILSSSFGMGTDAGKIDGAWSKKAIDDAANGRIQAIQQSEGNMNLASQGMVRETAKFYAQGGVNGSPMVNTDQSYYKGTVGNLKEFYATSASTTIKSGVGSSTGSKSSSESQTTFSEEAGFNVNFGKLIDPAGGLSLGGGGGIKHQQVYSSSQYSDFKQDWSKASTREMRSNVLTTMYSEGLSNISHMNVSASEKVQLKAKLYESFMSPFQG